jgi:hypothetical protein
MKDTMSDNRGVNLVHDYAKGMRMVHEAYRQYEIQSDERKHGLKKKDINCEKL